MLTPLQIQRRLDIATGIITEVVNRYEPQNLHTYFSSLTILNTTAHIYGVVYLASLEAMAMLKAADLK